MEIDSCPNLIDPIHLNNIKKFISKTDTSPKQLGGFFGFLSEKYRDNLIVIYVIIFFIVLVIFLYYRYLDKLKQKSQNPINEFVQSVDNYLYNPYSYYSY